MIALCKNYYMHRLTLVIHANAWRAHLEKETGSDTRRVTIRVYHRLSRQFDKG